MAQSVSMTRFNAAQAYAASMKQQATELRAKGRELNKKLQEARKAPIVNLAIGVTAAAAGGVAAAVADKAMKDPLYTVGGDATTGAGGVKIRASLAAAAGAAMLAQYEESDTLADGAKGAIGYAVGKIADDLIGDIF